MISYLIVVLICMQRAVAFKASFGHRAVFPTHRSQSLKSVPGTSTVEEDIKKQIYCNVELNGRYIEAVGFDLDFTLAQYNDKLITLIFDSAKKLLAKQYSGSVLDFESKPNSIIRGLVIDQQRGNILKIDRHKYVRTATHGSRLLPAEARKLIYTNEVASYSEGNFVNIDNVHLLAAAQLFSCMVDLADKSHPSERSNYEDIYRDVQSAVGESVQEGGVVPAAVKADPGRYIDIDAGLVPTLLKLRSAGKKTFLLTNSLYDYTHSVMDYVVTNSSPASGGIDWKDLFDIVITGAHKPDFLTHDALSLFKVDSNTGTLHNIEYKEGLDRAAHLATKLYQGGNWLDLHRMLGVTHGDKILYVADHMFSDILRSKRSLGWRTCLVIPELERETLTSYRERHLLAKELQLRQSQDVQDKKIDSIVQNVRVGTNTETELNDALQAGEQLKTEVRVASAAFDDKFNVPWGQIFKAGMHDSRFAKQVRNYACLYTSKMSNLQYVSPNKTFRPHEDALPHELL